MLREKSDRDGDKSENYWHTGTDPAVGELKTYQEILTLQIYLEISSQLKPSGVVCGFLGELIDNY